MRLRNILLPVIPFAIAAVTLINYQNSHVPKDVVFPRPYTITGLKVDELVKLTNIERTNAGLKALVHNTSLDRTAKIKCMDMLTKDYWSHESPTKETAFDIMTSQGILYYKAGENLAYGFLNSQTVVSGWMKSDKHRPNMLDTKFTDVGFAICYSSNYIGRGKNAIIVQHFINK